MSHRESRCFLVENYQAVVHKIPWPDVATLASSRGVTRSKSIFRCGNAQPALQESTDGSPRMAQFYSCIPLSPPSSCVRDLLLFFRFSSDARALRLGKFFGKQWIRAESHSPRDIGSLSDALWNISFISHILTLAIKSSREFTKYSALDVRRTFILRFFFIFFYFYKIDFIVWIIVY